MNPTLWCLCVGFLVLVVCVSVTNAGKKSLDRCRKLDCAQCLTGDTTNMTSHEKQCCTICERYACNWILKWTFKNPLRTECKACYCKGGSLKCENTCHQHTKKEGYCPFIWEQSVVDTDRNDTNDTCSDECNGDYTCDGRKKCCPSKCGLKCLMPSGCRYRDKRRMVDGQTLFLERKICTCDKGSITCSDAYSTPYLKRLLKQAKQQD